MTNLETAIADWKIKRRDLIAKGEIIEPVYNCKDCRDIGWLISEDEQGNKGAKECKCSVIKKALLRLKRSGLEELANSYTYDNYDLSKPYHQMLINMARSYQEDVNENWLFIGGQSGVGKTHICTALCVELIKKGNNVCYFRWLEEGRKAKALVNSEDYDTYIDKYLNCDILYIDDIFKDQVNSYGGVKDGDFNLAYRLINHRYNKNAKTIITSEKSIQELRKIDAAIAGRIDEKVGKYYAHIPSDPSKDYRVEKAKKQRGEI